MFDIGFQFTMGALFAIFLVGVIGFVVMMLYGIVLRWLKN